MLRRALPLVLGGCFWASGAGMERAPVLVELFTSEGCSSCPPADRLLETLDPSAIVLSEHVDYWDRLGWRDPFSAHANTLRQEAYSRRFATQGPYTPQMVVDGRVEFVGSDARRAAEEIAHEAASTRVSVNLSRAAGQLMVETGAVTRDTDVFLAITDDHEDSQVTAGENRGRHLRHVSILRSLKRVGRIPKGSVLRSTVPLANEAAGQRLIVFLQESNFGKISGAGLLVP